MSDTIEVAAISPRTSTAPSPFDRSNADIILRTSDHLDFHVFSQILIAASPFFEGMFQVPQPLPEAQQLKIGRQIIEITEDSKTLLTLLQICYPINGPTKWTLEDIESALRAAMKYQMELPTTVLMEDLGRQAPASPMQVWAISCRLGLGDIAAYAAGHLASLPKLTFSVLGEMRGISAGHYFRLRKYYMLAKHQQASYQFLTPPSPSEVEVKRNDYLPPANFILPDHFQTPDLLCRSADGGEWKVHTTMLSLASPGLRDQIASLSTLSSPDDRELSTLTLGEDGDVCQILLLIIYRIHTPPNLFHLSPSKFMALLAAVRTYRISSEHVDFEGAWEKVAAREPLVAYCAAIRAGDPDYSRVAARFVLYDDITHKYIPEFECTPALAYHRLLVYYQQCSQNARTKLEELIATWTPPPQPLPAAANAAPVPVRVAAPPPKGKAVPKPAAPAPGPVRPPAAADPWLQRYARRLAGELHACPGKAAPSLAQIFVDATRSAEPRVWCAACAAVAEGIIDLNRTLQGLASALLWDVSRPLL